MNNSFNTTTRRSNNSRRSDNRARKCRPPIIRRRTRRSHSHRQRRRPSRRSPTSPKVQALNRLMNLTSLYRAPKFAILTYRKPDLHNHQNNPSTHNSNLPMRPTHTMTQTRRQPTRRTRRASLLHSFNRVIRLNQFCPSNRKVITRNKPRMLNSNRRITTNLVGILRNQTRLISHLTRSRSRIQLHSRSSDADLHRRIRKSFMPRNQTSTLRRTQCHLSIINRSLKYDVRSLHRRHQFTIRIKSRRLSPTSNSHHISLPGNLHMRPNALIKRIITNSPNSNHMTRSRLNSNLHGLREFTNIR